MTPRRSTSTSGSAATLYVEPEHFEADTAEVTGDAYRHLFRARRLAVDDRLRVVDGRGGAREGRIAVVERHRASVELGVSLASRESSRRLSLLVASPRAERASWLVEKAAELGVSRIAWITCERSSRALSPSAKARHSRVAIAALEQSGRERLPTISGPHAWSEVPELVASLDRWWVLDPTGERRLAPPVAADHVGLVIGPEGGWEDRERDSLKDLGGDPWTLGERILRIETAAIAGAALLLAPA